MTILKKTLTNLYILFFYFLLPPISVFLSINVIASLETQEKYYKY